MKFRITALAVILAAAAAPSAFASTLAAGADGGHDFQSWSIVPQPLVEKARAAASKTPMADSITYVSADGSYTMPQHSHVLPDGQLVHPVGMPHSNPSLIRAASEQQQFEKSLRELGAASGP